MKELNDLGWVVLSPTSACTVEFYEKWTSLTSEEREEEINKMREELESFKFEKIGRYGCMVKIDKG